MGKGADGIVWRGVGGGVFRGMVEESLREEGICGPGSMGESDVESWVGDDEAWDRMMGGGVEGKREAEEGLEGGEGVECQMEDGDGGDEWVGEGGDGMGVRVLERWTLGLISTFEKSLVWFLLVDCIGHHSRL